VGTADADRGTLNRLAGSAAISSALALIEPAVDTVAFYLHELIWQRRMGPLGQAPSHGH
jgi:uncharacterized membrane protein